MHVYRSRIIDAPIDAVWQVVRAFDAVADWNPGVESARMISGAPTEVGGVRHLDIPGGGVFVETLLGHSDVERSYTYRIDESALPVTDYVATHRLQEVTGEAQTFSTWEADFQCDPARAEKLESLVGDAIFMAAMDGLASCLRD